MNAERRAKFPPEYFDDTAGYDDYHSAMEMFDAMSESGIIDVPLEEDLP